MRDKTFNFASDCRPCCAADTLTDDCTSFDACVGFKLFGLAGLITIEGECGPCNGGNVCYLDSPVTVGTRCLPEDAQWGPDDVKIYDPCKGSRYGIITRANGSSGFVTRYSLHIVCDACVKDPLGNSSRSISIGIQVEKKIAANTWIIALPWIYKNANILYLCYNTGVGMEATYDYPSFSKKSLIRDVKKIVVGLSAVPVYPPCKTCDMFPCYGRITCVNATLIPNTSSFLVASSFHEKGMQMAGLTSPADGSCQFGKTENLGSIGVLGCPGEAVGVDQYIQTGTQKVAYGGEVYIFMLILKCVGSSPCLSLMVFKVVGASSVACGGTVFGTPEAQFDNEEPWVRGWKIANPCTDIPTPFFHVMLYGSKAEYVEIGDCTGDGGSGGGGGGSGG